MENRTYIVMLFCLSISAMFCGCTESEYGKGKSEPMSFSADICSLTQTRAAVDTAKNSGTNLIVLAAEPAKGITESVSKMTRTSTADGSWPSGANISVQQGGTTKQYTVYSNGNITSSSPFFWANKDNVSVTSWYPYSASLPATWTVNSDQSTETNYGGSDLLYASNTFTYGEGSNNTLQYSHQTAKVVINVTRPGYASDPSNIASITIGTSDTPIDLSGAVGSDGAITATSSTTGYITPYSLTPTSNYSATYTALVIPQDMQNKQFIAIKVYNTTYYYKPATSTPLLAGHEYDYNITIPVEYYFSDGTWGLLADHATSTVHPIGVVFSKATSAHDRAMGWTHGYAMALTNASTNYTASTCIWGPDTEENVYTFTDTYGTYTYTSYGSEYYSTFTTNKDGYCETQVIKSNHTSTLQSSYPAFYYALNYSTYTAPSGSSGWYLPSIGQWYDIYTNLGGISTTPTYTKGQAWCRWYSGDNSGDTNNYSSLCANSINLYLTAISTYSSNKGYNYGTPDSFSNSGMSYGNNSGTYGGEYYWSSSECSSTTAGNISFSSNGNLDLYDDGKNNGYYFRVRPVIAF